MSTATEMLAKYMAAELAILEGKEAQLGDRRVRLEDLAEIRAGRKEWESRVASEQRQAGGSSGLAIGGATFSIPRFGP